MDEKCPSGISYVWRLNQWNLRAAVHTSNVCRSVPSSFIHASLSFMPATASPMFRVIYLMLAATFPLFSQTQEKADIDQQAEGVSPLAAARQRLKKLSSHEYDLDGIHLRADTREVRLPAKVELKKGAIEYVLVHETGKTHESVLTTAISPLALQLALLLTDYQPASQGLLSHVPETEQPRGWKEDLPVREGGNLLRIEVEWEQNGQTQRAPLSRWVQNVDTQKSPPDLDRWIYNGSYTDERGFISESEGSIIAVWLDRGALINSPAKGAWRDDLWVSFSDHIPEEGTPVTIIISPVPTP